MLHIYIEQLKVWEMGKTEIYSENYAYIYILLFWFFPNLLYLQ